MFDSTPDMQDLAIYDIDCFLFLNQNICCWYSRDQSQGDGSFEYSHHVLKLRNKKSVQKLAFLSGVVL